MCGIAIADPTMPFWLTTLIVSAASTAASVGVGIVARLIAPKPAPLQVNKQSPQVQTSEYGHSIARVYGNMGNVAGEVIDYFPLTFKETKKVTPGQGGKNKTPDTIQYSYSATIAIKVCKGPIHGITQITADTTVVYTGSATGSEVEGTSTFCSGLHIYLGNETQEPDSYFEAEHGVGNVPAYRGDAYVVLRDFVFDQFFNRIPNFTFQVVQGDGTLSDICATELKLSGLTDGEIDVTELAEDTIGGYWIAQRTSVRQAVLEPLCQAKQFDFVEIDGKIKAFKRPRTSEVTVPWEDLGSYDYDQSGAPNTEKPARTESTRVQDADIARGVDVVYFDSGRNYEKSTQGFDRQIFNAVERQTATFNLAMTANEANRIAKVIACTNWNERTPFKFSLPPKYLRFTNGTVMTIQTLNGSSFDVRVEKMTFGIPGVIQVEARTQLADAYAQIGEGDVGLQGSGDFSGGYGSTPISLPGVLAAADALVMFSSVNGLKSEYKDMPGFYAWATKDPADVTANHVWMGVTIKRNLDGGTTYQTYGNVFARGTFGKSYTTLADASGVDTTNTVDVDLVDDSTLESITDDAFTNSRVLNIAVLGNEKIQFRDVTRPDAIAHPRRWRLSHLRRGIESTPTSGHTSSDDFGLVDAACTFFSTAYGESGTIHIDYIPPDGSGGGGTGDLILP